MILIRPTIPQPCTELYFGRGLFESRLLLDLCQRLGPQSVVIADRSLHDLAQRIAHFLHAELLEIPNDKSQSTLEHLANHLLQNGYGRDTVIVAIGGGATTDLAGFLAATFMRGLPLILIPTTLLAMVDASIGGKTAIDTAYGKNLIGAQYHPQAIVVDFDALKTLPQKERLNGLSEMAKLSLIYDAGILPLLDPNHISEELIERCMRGKIAIIEQDPLEKGLRRILNFGHTIGHAIETDSHGQSVAIGSLTASFLSMHLGFLPNIVFEQIVEQYRRIFGRLKLPPSYDRAALMRRIVRDKKNENQNIRFVLIDRIGHAMDFDGKYCRPIENQDLDAAIGWMEEHGSI